MSRSRGCVPCAHCSSSQLGANNLTGVIPPSIAGLTSLQQLCVLLTVACHAVLLPAACRSVLSSLSQH